MREHVLPPFLASADTFRNKNLVVTGGCGFLGGYVCQILAAMGARVIRIDPRAGEQTTANGRYCDLALRVEDAELREVLAKTEFDVVFHLAGAAYAAQSVVEPMQDLQSNLYATVQFLETLRAIEFHGRVVYASSAAVYGEPAQLPITEETRPMPISPYGVSKFASENYLNVYAKLFDMQVVCARLFSLFGPGQRKQVVFDLIRKALESDSTVQVLGDGNEVRDLMYVEDAAAALVLLATLPRAQTRTVNVCSGQTTTVRALAGKIAAKLNLDPGRICFTGVRRPGDPVVWAASNKLLLSTGFQVRTGLDEGLRRTIEWYRTEPHVE